MRPQDGLCGKCKDGYFMSGYKCIRTEFKNETCYVQESEQKCYICKNGYREENGTCFAPVPIQDASNNFDNFNTDSGFDSGFDSSFNTPDTTTSITGQ